GVDWGAIDLEATDKEIERWIATRQGDLKWARRFRRQGVARTALEGAARDLKFFMRAIRAIGERTNLRQHDAEWKFGATAHSMLPVEIRAGASGEVLLAIQLHGKIDRVDKITGINPPTFVIFDFKSGTRKMSLNRLAHGLELQLPLYAAAL